LRIKAKAFDQLAAVFGGLQVAAGGPRIAAEAPQKVVPSKPSLGHLTCFITGASPETDDVDLFGIGVGVGNGASLTTSGDLLSKSAFDGGVRKSSMNEAFEFFLPIYISEQHFGRCKQVFKASVEAIYASMMSKRKSSSNNNNKAKVAPEIQALEIVCSLMNSACVATSGANDKYHDRFIGCYMSLLRLLKWIVLAFPSAAKHAEASLARFEKGERDKNAVPNLGEFVVLFHAVGDEKILSIVVEEVDARNVRWFKDPVLLSAAPCKGRLAKSFAETEISRTLLCFQIAFLGLTKKTDFSKFVDGQVDASLLKVCISLVSHPSLILILILSQSLKNLHATVKAHKSWADYFAFLHLPVPTAEEREAQLVDAVRWSEKCGYHKPGGNKRR
jgi:hypothetical protein